MYIVGIRRPSRRVELYPIHLHATPTTRQDITLATAQDGAPCPKNPVVPLPSVPAAGSRSRIALLRIAPQRVVDHIVNAAVVIIIIVIVLLMQNDMWTVPEKTNGQSERPDLEVSHRNIGHVFPATARLGHHGRRRHYHCPANGIRDPPANLPSPSPTPHHADSLMTATHPHPGWG